MNVVKHFFEKAETLPEQIALIEGKRKISFVELRNEVLSTAAYYKKIGLDAGDRILVAVPMSIDLYRSVLAIFYIGAVAVFVDEWVNAKRLNLLCVKADCKAFVASPKISLLAYFFKGTRNIALKLSLKKRGRGTVEMFHPVHSDTALITFTTGSTGEPKAADRTHAFLNEQFRVLSKVVKMKEGEVDMPVLPIVLFLNLGAGRTSVIMKWKAAKPSSLKTKEVFNQIEKYNIKSITASPSFLRILAKAQLNRKKPLNVSEVYTGGAPVFKKDAVLFKEAFNKANSTIIYGSTEAEPISTLNTEKLLFTDIMEDGGLYVGEKHAELDLLIISFDHALTHRPSVEEFKASVLKDGEIGEVLVSGDHVLKRYFKSEKAFIENKIIVEAKLWHKTGDSGFLRGSSLYLTGRVKQHFTMYGMTYLPFVIEYEIIRIKGVRQGTILNLGEELVLCFEGDAKREDFKEVLGKYKVDRLIKLAKIPMDKRHHAKIDYTALRMMIK